MSERLWERESRQVQSFRYPVIQPPVGASPEVLGLGTADGYKARDLALQREISAAVEGARKQGFADGLAQANAAAAQAAEQERTAVQQALQDFAGQQTNYFRRLETEAVRLALSIARKVLHREAQMDPLLLAGVVRVALDQMQAGTRLTLRTSPESAGAWDEFCRKSLPRDRMVEVVSDTSLQSHQCVLQADVRTTEISLDTQLQEIESGFFDLLREKVEAQP